MDLALNNHKGWYAINPINHFTFNTLFFIIFVDDELYFIFFPLFFHTWHNVH